MCPRHFEMYGVGLGLGRGQKLVVIDDQVPDLDEIEVGQPKGDWLEEQRQDLEEIERLESSS